MSAVPNVESKVCSTYTSSLRLWYT